MKAYSQWAVTLMCLAAATSIRTSPSPVRVATPSLGTVTGLSQDGVDSFLGLKYGVPLPRFEKAKMFMITNTTEAWDASTYGPWCPQADPGQGTMDEDCLFLNIWRPSGSADDNHTSLPVMLYIHGGGFETGSGADVLFESSDLARQTGNIVVTINYRLGPLGFLVKDDSGAGGMNGLADALLAVQWVKKNIESFGGMCHRPRPIVRLPRMYAPFPPTTHTHR